MYLKRVQPDQATEDGVLSVLAEPLPGHSDEEVARRLAQSGATEIAILAPGFVSARLSRRLMKELEDVAVVHVKSRKQFRT